MTPRTARRTMKVLAMIVVVAYAASACGGSDDTAEVHPPETTAGSDTESTEDAESANQDEDVSPSDDEPADDSDEPETLEDYLGTDFFSFDPEAQAANRARQEQQVQELIVECMTREGFEYIAVTRPFDDFGFGGPEDVEFAADFGFGITTFYGETEPPWFQDDWIDPNQAIVEGLSESERNAYYDTLHGSSFSSGGFGFDTDSATATTVDGSDSEEEVVVDSGFEGCSGQAYEEVYAFDDLQEVYEQLDLSSLYERVEADPRAAKIYAEWSECMAERGYDYEDPDTLYESVYTEFQERLEEIVGSTGGFFDPFAGMSDEEIEELMTSLSPEEMDDFFTQEQQTVQQDIDQEALAALQAEERALAVVNAECSGGLYEQFIELTREYEAALVDENRALLEQFRDSREG